MNSLSPSFKTCTEGDKLLVRVLVNKLLFRFLFLL